VSQVLICEFLDHGGGFPEDRIGPPLILAGPLIPERAVPPVILVGSTLAVVVVGVIAVIVAVVLLVGDKLSICFALFSRLLLKWKMSLGNLGQNLFNSVLSLGLHRRGRLRPRLGLILPSQMLVHQRRENISILLYLVFLLLLFDLLTLRVEPPPLRQLPFDVDLTVLVKRVAIDHLESVDGLLGERVLLVGG
jgi:hypothetical protein